MSDWPFGDLPRGEAGAILSDPPWRFRSWSETNQDRATANHYSLMETNDIASLPVADLAAPDCVLFMWISWPMLKDAMALIEAWGFTYKTCAFSWLKANALQVELFDSAMTADMKLGYWTRANSEVCLLAIRGKPKRRDAGVRQGIIEPAREHSRKPSVVYERIERLVAGPYVELFARTRRAGWLSWGNQTDKFKAIS